jgi:hypothetical protein
MTVKERLAQSNETMTEAEREEAFLDHLMEIGLLIHRPPANPAPDPYPDFQGVTVIGKPLSETAIEERR